MRTYDEVEDAVTSAVSAVWSMRIEELKELGINVRLTHVGVDSEDNPGSLQYRAETIEPYSRHAIERTDGERVSLHLRSYESDFQGDCTIHSYVRDNEGKVIQR